MREFLCNKTFKSNSNHPPCLPQARLKLNDMEENKNFASIELTELERLLELQRSRTRWFSQEELSKTETLLENIKSFKSKNRHLLSEDYFDRLTICCVALSACLHNEDDYELKSITEDSFHIESNAGNIKCSGLFSTDFNFESKRKEAQNA